LRCVATSFGSAGDFFPTVAVAAAMKRAGHDVVLVANPFYENVARKAGLDFVPVGRRIEVYEEVERNPRYLHPVHGIWSMWKDFGISVVTDTYYAMREAVRGADVVLASNISFAGVWAAAERGVPSVLTSPTPIAWPNPRAPMQLLDRALPEWMLPAAATAARTIADAFVGHELSSLGRTLGVSARDASLAGTEAMVALHLGLWSPLMRPHTEGDPPSSVVCGFARAGSLGSADNELAPEILAFLDAGEPPVVVGLGSVFSMGAGELLTDVALACEKLGRRCLIVGHPAATARFAGDTLAVKYAPYHLVFPRAAAVVVHAGAGTTAEALRAGRPVLALPFAYDQFGVAWQVERLGAGIKVSKSDRSPEALAKIIERALADETMAQRAAELGESLSAERDGAEVAAELIEGRISADR